MLKRCCFFRLQNDLLCVRWGVKLDSLTLLFLVPGITRDSRDNASFKSRALEPSTSRGYTVDKKCSKNVYFTCNRGLLTTVDVSLSVTPNLLHACFTRNAFHRVLICRIFLPQSEHLHGQTPPLHLGDVIATSPLRSASLATGARKTPDGNRLLLPPRTTGPSICGAHDR